MKLIPILLLAFAASAQAEIIAVAQAEGGTIELHDQRGACVDSLQALWVSSDQKQRVPGCWRTGVGPNINIVFLDVSTAEVPIPAFSKPEKV